MTPIKTILAPYKSLYEAEKAFNIHRGQLSRWVEKDAHVNAQGEIYIKTKGKLEVNGD